MAAFSRMTALSSRNDAPERASRPFDADRDGQDRGGDEIQDRGVARARVVEPALRQEREQSGQEKPEREAVPEPRPPEQEGRPQAEPAGRP